MPQHKEAVRMSRYNYDIILSIDMCNRRHRAIHGSDSDVTILVSSSFARARSPRTRYYRFRFRFPSIPSAPFAVCWSR